MQAQENGMKMLVTVDTTATAARAIDFVIAHRDWYREPVEIHLLNVQPSVHDDVGRFVGHAEIRGYQHDEGLKALAPARAALDAAGLSHTPHVGVGDDPAAVIEQFARDLGVNQIVMGVHGRLGVSGLLLGSVANRVVHRASVPVLLVR